MTVATGPAWAEPHYHAADRWCPWRLMVIDPEAVAAHIAHKITSERWGGVQRELSDDAIGGQPKQFAKPAK